LRIEIDVCYLKNDFMVEELFKPQEEIFERRSPRFQSLAVRIRYGQ